jgi:hypothetical protein
VTPSPPLLSLALLLLPLLSLLAPLPPLLSVVRPWLLLLLLLLLSLLSLLSVLALLLLLLPFVLLVLRLLSFKATVFKRTKHASNLFLRVTEPSATRPSSLSTKFLGHRPSGSKRELVEPDACVLALDFH